MGWRGAGLKVLRWVLWLLFGWVFLRGIFTFVPTAAGSDLTEPSGAETRAAAEPAGLRSFPALFAREYFTWEPAKSGDRSSRLQPFLAQHLDRQAGWSSGRDGVGQLTDGTWIHSVKALPEGRWLITVAVRVEPYEERTEYDGTANRTNRKSLAGSVQYLAVPISPTAAGGWVVFDYPSLVSLPGPGEFTGALHSGQEVADSGDLVKTLAGGFFRAYLGGAGDVSYFLAPDVKLPPLHATLAFQSVGEVILVKTGTEHAALAEVQVVDPTTEAKFTYRYSLALTQRDGRWYIKDLLQRGD